ncbi:MAG: metallophosphoesterase [Phycisphaerae bacterium]
MRRKTLVQLHRSIVPIRGLPAALAGMRIVHLSDLHLSVWTDVVEQTQQLLSTLELDLLVVTGDFSHNPPEWRKTLDLLARFFDPIASVAPIYGVLGNHDLPQVAEHHQSPIRFLRNESTVIRFNGAEVRLAGVEQVFDVSPHSEQGLRDLEKTLTLSANAHGDPTRPTGRNIPTILLAHFPSTVYNLPNGVAQRPPAAIPAVPEMPGRGRPGYAVDLVLSGHTHGGQIRLPGLGCIWANDAIPLSLARGLHRAGGTLLHTSAGIGVSGPLRLRLNCPAELTLLSLQPTRLIGPTASRPTGPPPPRPPRVLSGV